MKFNRKSIRLRGYDYAQAGAYFITICANAHLCVFGEVDDGVMKTNLAGDAVARAWEEISLNYPGVNVDALIVMPNHVHGVIILSNETPSSSVGATPCGCPVIDTPVIDSENEPGGRLLLPDVIGRYKSWTTKLHHDGVKQHGWPPSSGRLWQRNYYDRIIRSETELMRIREYIINNPANWDTDEHNPLIRQGGHGDPPLQMVKRHRL